MPDFYIIEGVNDGHGYKNATWSQLGSLGVTWATLTTVAVKVWTDFNGNWVFGTVWTAEPKL